MLNVPRCSFVWDNTCTLFETSWHLQTWIRTTPSNTMQAIPSVSLTRLDGLGFCKNCMRVSPKVWFVAENNLQSRHRVSGSLCISEWLAQRIQINLVAHVHDVLDSWAPACAFNLFNIPCEYKSENMNNFWPKTAGVWGRFGQMFFFVFAILAIFYRFGDVSDIWNVVSDCSDRPNFPLRGFSTTFNE